MDTEELNIAEARTAPGMYEKPRVITFGTVEKLTQGGVGSHHDFSGTLRNHGHHHCD